MTQAEDVTQQNIEDILARLDAVFHEPDEAKAQAALDGLDGTLPEGLHERLVRVPDFSALAASLTAHADLLQAYPATFGVLAALRANRPELLSHAGAEVVAPLVLICQSKAKKISKTARAALLSLTNPAAQEELCRLATDEELVVAREIAVEAGFTPRDGRARALYLFLTGQWEQYESLDFDAGLMRTAYETAERRLQQFIAKVGREAGRPEIFKIMSGRGNRELNFDEWQAAAHALIQGERWQDAWTMALKAPPTTAALLFKKLIEIEWQPEDTGERISFADLAKRAKRLRTTNFPFGYEISLVPESEKAAPSWFHNDSSRSIVQTLVTPDRRFEIIRYYGLNPIEIWDIDALDIVWIYDKTLEPSGKDPNGNWTGDYIFERLSLSLSGDHLVIVERTESFAGNHYRFLLFETATGQLIQAFYPPHHDYYWTDYTEYDYDYGYYTPPNYVSNPMVTISSDGRFGAAIFNNQYAIWEIGNSNPFIQERLTSGTDNLFFTPDGSRLFVGNMIFDTQKWQSGKYNRLEFDYSTQMVFSADSELLALVSNDGKIELYHLFERRFIKKVQANFGNVFSIAFSPDKKRLATGHWRIVRIWDVPSLELVSQFEAHTRNVSQLWFSADSKALRTYGDDGKLKDWQTLTMLRSETPIEKLSIQDLLDLRKRYAKSPDKAWFAFMDGLVSRRFQHAIELGELDPAVSADEFDIELE
jgi:WD40 repeat protein